MKRLGWMPCGLVCALLIAGPAAAEAKACDSPAAYSYDSGGRPGTAGPANDPLFARQWGLDLINAPEAWARGARGAGAVIAIIDTGVDLKHPDLKDKLVDGIDLVDGGANCPRGPQDENGHGTHVAGIAAAATNNGIGIAGVAPKAKIMPVRVLDAEGSGSREDLIAGIRWAADHGAHVLNLSLSRSRVVGQQDDELEAAVAYAWARGAVVVAQAGDVRLQLCSWPAYATQAICVAATDSRGQPTYYSSLAAKGPDPTLTNGWQEPFCITFVAPGGLGTDGPEDDENVWGPIWPGAQSDGGSVAGYDALAGTSMATPFVSGVAALLVGQGLTNRQVRDRLVTTASGHPGWSQSHGKGMVDADKATRPDPALNADCYGRSG